MITKSGDEPLPPRLESGIRIREVGKIGNGMRERYFGSATIVLNTHRAIMEENANVYYQRTASALTGFVGFSCLLANRPLVFGSSSYWDSNDSLNGRMKEDTPLTTLRIASPIYRYGLSRASEIVTQTEDTASQFRIRFPQKKVTRIPSLSTVPPSSPEKDNPPFVLYVTRLVWYRRPLLFIQIAKALPQIKFVLAGYGPLEGVVKEKIKTSPNIEFVGPVSWNESIKLIGRATAFLNTSSVEGFPNTLLECLACRTSYVSLFDPDEVICKQEIGVHPLSFQQTIGAVRELVTNGSRRMAIAEKGLSYLKAVHDPEVILKQYESLFIDNASRRILGGN